MSYEDDGDSAEMQALELEGLKSKATLLGIKFHPTIGVDTLRVKIQAALAETEPKANEESIEPVSVKESIGAFRSRKRQEANKLVRVRITCMNPAKKNIEGEIFTVANRSVGTIKKYVPFNVDEGWHVPQMILNMIRERKCQVFVKERSRNGVTMKRGKLINEFNVEVLPELTLEELQQLAQRQAMARGE